MTRLDELERRITRCRRCPRLVAYRERVAREKRRQFRDCDYWGRPVPGFGPGNACVLIIGLAPAAHGGNRTGRVFTGDRSGDWLFEALHNAGFADRPESRARDDGLHLTDCYVTAAVRCAPPGNKPTSEERDACRGYLVEEIGLLRRLRVVVALGRFAFDAYLQTRRELGQDVPRPKPQFGHGVVHELAGRVTLVASYHPSQQNTFTGTLTREMFHNVFRTVRDVLDR